MQLSNKADSSEHLLFWRQCSAGSQVSKKIRPIVSGFETGIFYISTSSTAVKANPIDDQGNQLNEFPGESSVSPKFTGVFQIFTSCSRWPAACLCR
jgi:hypothetical protein